MKKQIINVEGNYRVLVKKFAWNKASDATKFLFENTNKKLRTLGEDGEFIYVGTDIPDGMPATEEILRTQIAFRFNTTIDKISNIQIDDENQSVSADIEGICKFCGCGWIEDYTKSLEEYKEKIKQFAHRSQPQ